MAEKLTVTQLLERNKQIAVNPQPMPFFSELGSMGLEPPHLLVLTCVDPRCNPDFFLGLKPGEGVVVLRNICGHVPPALNDILALDNLLNLSGIMIIHHNDCGSTHFKDAQVRETLKKRVPDNKEIDDMVFGAVTDIEQSVKDDLKILKSTPLLRAELAEHAYGFVYDIKTSQLTPVKA